MLDLQILLLRPNLERLSGSHAAMSDLQNLANNTRGYEKDLASSQNISMSENYHSVGFINNSILHESFHSYSKLPFAYYATIA